MVEIKEKDLVLCYGRVYEIKCLPKDIEDGERYYDEGILVLTYFDCEDSYYSRVLTLEESVLKIMQVWRKNENDNYICIYKAKEDIKDGEK